MEHDKTFHGLGFNKTQMLVAQCYNDFELYARVGLRIKDKRGKISVFALNSAQRHVHRRLEEQKRRTGRVRAIVLKGRQQGISTYAEGRFFWLATMREGLQAFILTHEQAATDNIFSIASRYLSLCPLPVLRRPTVAENAKELVFSNASGYKVATAGSRNTGRSGTVQLFHGSEVAFWPNAEEHLAGIGQTVPDLAGTEVILESTANGVGNVFHQYWQDAEAGSGDFMPVFVPWFWQEEYRRGAEGFEPGAEDLEYMAAWGISPEQAAWRRAKIVAMKNDAELFDQEYPASPALAFRRVAGESYIKPAWVAVAMDEEHAAAGPLLMGIDPAEMGADKTAIVFRRGRVCEKAITYEKHTTMEVAGIAARLIEERNPEAVFVDAVGVGIGVYDRLCELFPRRRIVKVKSGAAANREGYVNLRAEMWGAVRDWLLEGASLPDDDALAGQLSAPGYRYDSSGRVAIEKKEDMRRRGVRSPDMADALALTFAFPVEARKDERMESWKDKLKPRMQRSAQAA